uniref:CASAMP N-terminal domain-containing protein n=1 Tax=Periophthalmus magnuspinnatus TaxID=409849 RepID=A0A3B4A8A3_9GOBI
MGEVQDVRDVKKPFVAPALKPFEHYDFSRAKICCNLTWLVSKAYGTESEQEEGGCVVEVLHLCTNQN